MRTKTKKRLLLVFLVFLSLFAVNPSAYAGKIKRSCKGGTFNGAYAHHQESMCNTEMLEATDLHFTTWQAETTVHINGWKVTIEGDTWFHQYFDDVDCHKISDHEVHVEASDGSMLYGHCVDVDVEFWLKPKWNTVRIKDIKWTSPSGDWKALPDHGWIVSDATSQKIVTIYNDEPTGGDTFKISNFEYYITEAYYHDLAAVPYSGNISNTYTLNPGGGSQSFNLDCDLECGHVYFHYTMLNTTNHVISDLYGDHGIACEVGGVMVPIDKLSLLAPYIGLASTILVATATTAIYAKRVKRRK